MVKFIGNKPKDLKMKEIKEPVFTKAELDAIKNDPNVTIGYYRGGIIGGPNFEQKPFSSEISKKLIAAKEKLNGTAKKRQCHQRINEFGWARLANWSTYSDNAKLVFGIKYSSPRGLTKTEKTIINKYRQLLGYLLQQVGWKGMYEEKDSLGEGNYIIPLDNPENIKLLYTLSPSIGFYYKSHRPDFETLKNLEYGCKYKQSQMGDVENTR